MTTKSKKPRSLTMNALEKWLKTQDPATVYPYGDMTDCLMARFARVQGYGDNVRAGISDILDDRGAIIASFSIDLDKIANYSKSWSEDRTYKGALDAIKEYKARQKET